MLENNLKNPPLTKENFPNSSNNPKAHSNIYWDTGIMTFDEIYFEYQKMVLNLALQYVQNIEDAEDIMQEVFVKVFDNLHSFKHKSNIKTWIYRIAINHSLDFIKAQKIPKKKFS